MTTNKEIYFDASTIGANGNKDREQTKVNVVDSEKKSLLSKNDVESYFKDPYGIVEFDEDTGYIILESGLTNNHGELLGMFLAMKVAEKLNIKTICGDSDNAIKYWSKGQFNEKNIKNESTVKLIAIVTEQRKTFETNHGEIKKISGDNNPADLGYHK